MSRPAEAGPFDGPVPGFHAKLNQFQGLFSFGGFAGEQPTFSITRLGPSGEAIDPLWGITDDRQEKLILPLRVAMAPQLADQIWWNENCVLVRHRGNDAGSTTALILVAGATSKISNGIKLADISQALKACALTGTPEWRNFRQAYYHSLLQYPGQADLWARLPHGLVEGLTLGIFLAIPLAPVSGIIFALIIFVQRLRKKAEPGIRPFFWLWGTPAVLVVIAGAISVFP